MKLRFATLLAACMLLAGCSVGSIINNIDSPAASMPSGEELDLLFESELPGPVLPPSVKPSEPICTDYTGMGLLRICYPDDSGAALKLQVISGDETIVYNLKGDGSNEDFSLQFGNGRYTARIMQNAQGDEYFAVKAKSFDVKMADENDAFLNSIQNVFWNYEMPPIKDVRKIVAGAFAGPEKDLRYSCVRYLYAYIVKHIKYDSDKLKNLSFDYVPDIVQTYEREKGICYDYSSLFAAMLRSAGIPAKLVKGYADYAPDSYHAWNEVFVDGRWIVVDTTRDATLLNSGGAFEMEKAPSGYSVVHTY